MNSIHNKSWILNNAVNPAQNKIVTWQDLKDNKFISAISAADNPSQCLSASNIDKAGLSLYSHHNNNQLVRYGHVIKSPYGTVYLTLNVGAYRLFSGTGTDNRLTFRAVLDNNSPVTDFQVNINNFIIRTGINAELPLSLPMFSIKATLNSKKEYYISPNYIVNSSNGRVGGSYGTDPNGERTKCYLGYKLSYGLNFSI